MIAIYGRLGLYGAESPTLISMLMFLYMYWLSRNNFTTRIAVLDNPAVDTYTILLHSHRAKGLHLLLPFSYSSCFILS